MKNDMCWVRDCYFGDGRWVLVGDEHVTKSDFQGIEDQLLAFDLGYVDL